MSQENINFGSFPDDPSADAIRTAFDKVQNNFNQIFGANAGGEVAEVNSVNRTAGSGITVNYPTGNVIVSANIACVQVSTSSLSIGRGSNGGSNATITQSSQTLVIDISPVQVFSNYFADVGNGLATFNGVLSSTSNSQQLFAQDFHFLPSKRQLHVELDRLRRKSLSPKPCIIRQSAHVSISACQRFPQLDRVHKRLLHVIKQDDAEEEG